ncbi:hypothetical protein AAG570_005357, partial [Ranatra chinensis]
DSSDFPADVFSVDERRQGAIVLHIVLGLYCFIVIAFVCNDYFLPSVDCICQDLKLSKDVGGATFMAFATSAPELFVNVIGTFLTESDLGVGTVVGSAVCNCLAVTACGGLAAATAIPLGVWPLCRDCLIYMVVVGVLTAVLWDGRIEWYEALVLLLLYVLYCVVLFCQKRIYALGRFFYHKMSFRKKEEEEEWTVESVWKLPRGRKVFFQAWWAFCWPVSFCLQYTVPDCKRHRNIYPLTFLVCIIWIAVTSYLVSWMMTLLGETFGISDSVMGLTLVAIGGSMPEMSSSVINARQGIGSMTISNALGGNTLDILLSLGLPWFIKTLLPSALHGGPVLIESPGLVYNNAAQLACVAVLFVAAASNKFRMDRKLGGACLVLYLLFIAFIVAVELDLFHFDPPHPPVCS